MVINIKYNKYYWLNQIYLRGRILTVHKLIFPLIFKFWDQIVIQVFLFKVIEIMQICLGDLNSLWLLAHLKTNGINMIWT